jgi:hypothetical protein
LKGRFVTGGYLLIGQPNIEAATDALGATLDPGTPLMVGISTLTAQQAHRSTSGPINGGVVAARWASGRPLLVRGVVGGRDRVDLNMFPNTADCFFMLWVGDGYRLVANTLRFR